MKNNNNLEVILFSKLPLTDPRQEDLLEWLTTIMQAIIQKQIERTLNRCLRILEGTAPICMS
jgi:hypothetical protein